jgi:hypothetical protein
LLQFFVEAENLDDDTKAILKLLKKAVAYLTIKKAIQHYSVRFDAAGFTILSAAGDPQNAETSGRSDSFNAFHGGLLDLKLDSSEKDGRAFFIKAKRSMAAYRDNSGSEAFNQAYDSGPLVNYTDPNDRTRGNENRKGFRF